MLYDNYKERIYKQFDKDFEIYNLLDFIDDFDDEIDDDFEDNSEDNSENDFEDNSEDERVIDENEAWFIKYISESLDHYLMLNNINLRWDYYDSFEDVFVNLNFNDSEKRKFEYLHEHDFEQISNLISYVLYSIIENKTVELNYNEIHTNIRNYLI